MKLLICTQVVDKHHPILGFFHGWILEFAKHFDEVHVVCLEKGKYELPGNVQVYSLGKEIGASKLRQLLTFYQIFSRLFFMVKVDYVFYHMGAIYNILGAPYFWLRRLRGTKFYWWKTHGQINLLGRVALQFTDRIYTAVAASYPIPSKKRHVIGHAIDVDTFVFSDKEKTIDLLFAGRFSRTKRIEQVIAVVQKLVLRGRFVSCTIVGQPVDPKYVSELREQIANADLEQHITILPPVNHAELISMYQTARVFFNPSEHDGLDKVILEAMACGAVPLTGNLSFKDILTPYNLFGEKGDIDWFAKRIHTLLDQDVVARQSTTAALREVVCQEHALSTLIDRIFTHG